MMHIVAMAVMLAIPIWREQQAIGGDDPLPEGAVARLGTTRFRHGVDGSFLAYLPDGKSLLTGANSWDPSIRLWDLEGREIRRFVLQAPDANEFGYTERTRVFLAGPLAALSPDGKTLAAWNYEPLIHLWDVGTGKKLPPLQLGEDDAMPCGLAFTSDSAKLATLTPRGLLILRDLATGKTIREFGGPVPPPDGMRGRPSDLGVILFSKDDRIVIATSYDRTTTPAKTCVKAWETATGKELYVQPGKLGYGGALSPDGKLLAYFDADYKHIAVADAASGETRRKIAREGGDWRSTVCLFSKDSTKLYVQRFFESEILMFDVATGELRRTIGPKGDLGRVPMGQVTLKLAPDEKTISRLGGGQAPRFFDVASGQEKLTDFSRYAARSVHFSKTGQTLLVGDESLTLRWWDWKQAKIVKTFTVAGHDYFPNLGIDSVGALAIASQTPPSPENSTFTLAVTNLSSKKQLAVITDIPGWSAFTVSADGRTVAVQHASEFKLGLHLYDLPSLKPRCIVPIGRENHQACEAVLSTDGTRIAVSTSDQSIGIFDGHKGKRLAEIKLPPECLHLFSGTFSPDNRTLAFDMEDGKVTIWEAASGKPRKTFGEDYDLKSGRLPVGKERNRFYDIYATNPHSACVTVAFSPDGKWLAHGRIDGSVEIWDVWSGKSIAVFKGHEVRVNTLAFSPDGAYLASGSSDTTVLVWKVPTGK